MHNNKKQVICLNTQKVYESITQAEQEYEFIAQGVTHSSIGGCCRGLLSHAGTLFNAESEQLQWAYYDDYTKGHIPCIEKEQNNWVICMTTGEVFKKKIEACRYFNIKSPKISNQLAGRRPTAGFHPVTGEPLVFKRYKEVTDNWRYSLCWSLYC